MELLLQQSISPVLFLLKSVLGVDVYIATTIAFSLSLIFNYIASMKYVFVAKEGLSVKKQMVIFLVTSVIGLLINQAVMYVGIEWLHVYYMLAKFLATAVTMVFNFVARHLLLEK
ncbi:GtrA family protein [uncultured Enterococcus sp.]|uniref:GtrA family protein n=1 Tax=uncultured Enterococcus sp. TaxID=167972 RepID=UPI002AA78467|nr:GtrA family protein [uncultured Enterococcus sp.]